MHYNILFKVCDHKGIDLSCFVVKTKPTTVFRAILNALYTATDAQYVFNVANDTLGFFILRIFRNKIHDNYDLFQT